MSSSENDPCAICGAQLAPYTCPKCHIRYCTLACYKNENHQQCSENFYRDQATEQLKQNQVDEAEKRKMLEILQKLSNFDDDIWSQIDGDKSTDELSDRLKHLDLDRASFETIWECLTETEREDFYGLYLDPQRADPDAISEVLWKPWWSQPSQPRISEVDATDTPETLVPAIQSDIPEFRTLFPSAPHPSVIYQLASLVFSYVYVKRRFNGDWAPYREEVCRLLWRLEPGLISKSHTIPSDCEDALLLVLEAIQQLESRVLPPTFFLFTLQDVLTILSDPSNLLAALSDMHSLFDIEYTRHAGAAVVKLSKKAFLSMKKLTFLLSFIQMLIKTATPPAPSPSSAASAETSVKLPELDEAQHKGALVNVLKDIQPTGCVVLDNLAAQVGLLIAKREHEYKVFIKENEQSKQQRQSQAIQLSSTSELPQIKVLPKSAN